MGKRPRGRKAHLVEGFPPPTPQMTSSESCPGSKTSLRRVFSLRTLQNVWEKSKVRAEEWLADIKRDGSVLKKTPRSRHQDRSFSHQGSAFAISHMMRVVLEGNRPSILDEPRQLNHRDLQWKHAELFRGGRLMIRCAGVQHRGLHQSEDDKKPNVPEKCSTRALPRPLPERDRS